MATQSDVTLHRRFWRIVVLVLVVLPFLPEIVTLSVSVVAELRGCHVGDDIVCTIGSLSSANRIIRLALKAGFLVGVSFSSGVAAIWLALCYVSITRGWIGTSIRLTLAFSVSLILAFFPYLGPMISIGHLVNPKCQPNEGGVGPCFMYGGNVGSIVHSNVFLSWEVFRGAPIAVGAFGLYVLFLFLFLPIAYRALGRRAMPSVQSRNICT
jgi:hypothetical protein